jgi:transcriptional regulator with XRE-family HTH domain
MTDQRLGGAVRFLRIRRRWRQLELAERAGVSQSVVSRIERGHLGSTPLDTVRKVAAPLDLRIDLVPRWRGGDLDRMRGARHSALHESVARRLAQQPGWRFAPEVSFSIFGERGVIDLLAWHEATSAVLVIELKTELVDLNELVGTLDRKARLAPIIVRERGWLAHPAPGSSWVIVANSSTARDRLAAHRSMLRAAYPLDGRMMTGWLHRPGRPVAALSFWSDGPATAARPIRRRVRDPTERAAC